MLEKFLRSPFIMMVMLLMVGTVVVAAKEEFPYAIIFISYILFYIVYFLLMTYHNKKHPERKIKVFTFTPYELREDDEGLQYMTFKAMRNVYIFYYIAIPISILILFLFENRIPYLAIWLLVLLGIVQYFIYWIGIRRAFQNGEEESC